jgi:capsular polysaccharide transport system permease protein
MGTRYGRSPGGYLWAVLEPVGFIAILSIAFGLVMHIPPLGRSFLLFYATGFLPFHLYQSLQRAISASIRFSRPLLMFPAVTWLDAVVARFVLNLLTGLFVIGLVLAGVMMFEGVRAMLDMPVLVLALGLTALLGLGVGTLNCLLFGLFPLWETVWGIAMRPLILISGVFFLVEDLPRVVQEVLWFNPLVHVIALMRAGIYPTYVPQYVAPLYPAVIGALTLALGMLFLRAWHKDIIARR